MIQRPHPASVLGTVALITPAIQAYSPPIVVPVLVLAALALRLVARPRPPWPRGRSAAWLAGCLAAVILFGLASALWAVDPPTTVSTAARVLGVVLCGFAAVGAAGDLDEVGRSRFARLLTIGFALGLANTELALLTGGATISWVHHAARFIVGPPRPLYMPQAVDTTMTLLALILWPVLAVVRRRFGRLAAAGLYGVGFLLFRQGDSMALLIAHVVAGAVFLAAWVLPKATAALVGAGTALGIFASPLLLRPAVTGWLTATLPLLKEKGHSWDHRRAIWEFVIGKIGERPLAGWGLGSSRAIPGGQTEIAPGVVLLPLHPHDAALQLWLELGVAGAVAGALFAAGLAWATYRAVPERTERAMAFAMITTGTVCAMVSYNLWHEWWLTFLFVAAGFFAAVKRNSPPAHLPPP